MSSAAISPTILTVGDVVFDIVTTVIFPIHADHIIMTEYPLLEPGGACNFAITAARLGLNCRMIGVCGVDLWGDLIVNILREEQVDVSLLRQFPSLPTTLVLALSDPGTMRQTYISTRVGGEDEYPADDVNALAALGSAQALYVQGYTLGEECIWPITETLIQAASGRIPIYFDPSPLLRDTTLERQRFVLAHTNVILGTESEYAMLPPGTVTNQIQIIKRNVRGCRLITPEDGRTQDFPAYPVHAIGSVAAGDAFNAGFIGARLRGFSLEDAAQIANATGAAKVERIGGGRKVPYLADVQRILRDNRIPFTLDDWHT